MKTIVLLLCLLILPRPAMAEEVVLGLSRDSIQITTNFEGSEILIFGAVKRESPIPEGAPLQVIVTVEGPSEPLTVYRKDRVLGIWANTDAVEIDAAPSFYTVATSAAWSDVISEVEDLRHKISPARAIRSVGATINNAQQFSEAVIRIRSANGLYQQLEDAVIVSDQTLFRTAIQLPADLTEGAYRTRIFLTRDTKVISSVDTVIDVRKVGLERWLFNLSRQQPLLYGLMSLAIAIGAGWGASAAFRFLKSS